MNKKYLSLVLGSLLLLFLFVGCTQMQSLAEDVDKIPETLRVHFIDVGQGDSILIQTPHNRENILIDGGSREAGQLVADYLKNHGVEKINLLIATHPHEDHIGGLVLLLKTFPVEKIIDSGKKHSSNTYKNYLRTILNQKIPLEIANDQKFTWEDGLELSILGPIKKDYEEINNYSVVAKLVYGQVSFLFTGDMEKQAERDILDKDLGSTILKVGHHGSRSSTSAHFLRKVNPEAAVISLGVNNDYGHPHEITLKKLEKAKVKVYRTDLQGTIQVITDGKQYQIKTQN